MQESLCLQNQHGLSQSFVADYLFIHYHKLLYIKYRIDILHLANLGGSRLIIYSMLLYNRKIPCCISVYKMQDHAK